MSKSRLERWRKSLLTLYPGLGLGLVFLGPYFFFQSLSFLHSTDYAAGTLSFLAGWALLRAGIDITRAYLATTKEEKEMT